MNQYHTYKTSLLVTNVLLALAAMLSANLAQAACTDNGDGTITCSGDSENNNTLLEGTITLDNASGPVTLTNRTTDGTTITGPGSTDIYGTFFPDIGAILRNTAPTVGQASTLVSNGASAITINNLGSKIMMDGSARAFDPSAWTNDVNGLLYNNGVLAGYASAISAGASTTSLTVNNISIDDGVFYPDLQSIGFLASIGASGQNAAAIFTNSASLTVNTNAGIGNIISFAGANYTAPALLDGSQYATNVTAGTTVINANPLSYMGDIYVVDKNPLLTSAQAANPSLVLAYSPEDVGPRNSIINLDQGTIGNLYLGSGAHVVNNAEGRIGNIFVDQSDSEVVSVVGGVADPLYKVHGDRTFTLNSSSLNSSQPNIGDITINDVAGSVNTINLTMAVNTYIYNTFTAQGLGHNTLNIDCYDQYQNAFSAQSPCNWQLSNVTGFTDFNLSGVGYILYGNYNVTGDINLIAKNFDFESRSSMTASNVVVGANASLNAPGGITAFNKTMGSITGNLINNGTINVGDATLNVSGDVMMNAGSKYIVDVGRTQVGQINALGNTTFSNGSILTPTINPNAFAKDGDSHLIATNAIGIPTIQNGDGFVQWSASASTGDLIITADLRVPDVFLSQVTPAAVNAVDAFFSYKGNDPLALELQADLQQFKGMNVIRASERLRPEVNDGAIRMVLGNTDKIFNIINSRLVSSYLPASNYASLAEPVMIAAAEKGTLSDTSNAASDPSSKAIWVQGFGDRGTQETLQGADGYSLSSAGVVMGADRELDSYENVRVGFAAGYARGNITNAGSTVNNRLDTNSFFAAAYGTKNYDNWYLNAALGVGRNTYDSRRQLVQNTATGQHDSWQLSSRLDAGWPILVDDNLTFVPMASLDYTHLKESSYRENGKVSKIVLDYSRTDIPPQPVLVNGLPQFSLESSPINLALQSRSFDSIRAGLGGKVIYSLQEDTWGAELELHGMYRHEFGDIAQDSTARFVFGGSSFSSPGIKPIRNDFIVGGSIRLTTDDENDQITLLTSYDANFREKYFGQIVSLNLRYDFDQAPRYIKNANAKLAAAKARQVPMQLVGATEKDIAEIQAAIQENPADDGLSAVDAEKQAAIDKTIKTWATALSNKSLDVYFNSYAANFVTPDGSTRQQWERKRKTEISKDDNPVIKISYLTIKPSGDHAVAVFTQTLAAGSEQEALQKVVDLENKNGRWLIVREDSIVLSD
jgi:outer membrane autotransporter protein